MNTKNAYIITGPTASGKSNFAHDLARRVNGAIINCDSVQIYRGIENISASPFAGRAITDEIDGVPYRLFSVFNLDKQISVADYIKMAREQYDDVIAHGFVPIFVGGTGYYINGLVNGIAEIPEISTDNRRRARELVACDISAARAMVPGCIATDPQRIARAIEVFYETGQHLSAWQKMPRVGAITPTPFRILINPPIDELRTRIASRIPQMISGGAVAEAEYILKNNFDPRRAIGAEQLCAYLRGEISRDAAIENWIIKTNQYAKRQRTWFKTQFFADLTINHIPNRDDLDLII
ncbi:MAG: tRNA (adenosine(37)-N6)-dimethylallyltransferase MiaA [Alphaproteobacteria bacterium]|nr:tRNA (adenosine(37)-N6)-dimethylallyltransferase MiaA [Alphaproteobacteria bacterium]